MNILRKLIGVNPNGGNGNAGIGPGNAGNGLLGVSPTDASDEMLRNIKFQVVRRDVGANNQRFQPFVGGLNGGNGNANGGNIRLSINSGNLEFIGAQQLDGEYLVLIPAELIASGQVNQKGSMNAGNVLGIEAGHLGALAIIIFAVLLL